MGAIPLFSLLFIVATFFLFPTVSAVPPVDTIFTGDTGLNVEVQLMSTYIHGLPRWSIIHIFNQTSGFQLTPTSNPNINCSIHMRDSQGYELLEIQATPDDDHWDLNGSAGVNTPIGDYAYTVSCNDYDSEVGGYHEGYFSVVQDPEIVRFTDTSSDWRIFLILLVLAVVLLVISIYTENYIFAFFSGLMFLLSGVYGMIYGFDNINDFYTRAISIILIGIGMIITVISGLDLSKATYSQGQRQDE